MGIVGNPCENVLLAHRQVAFDITESNKPWIDQFRFMLPVYSTITRVVDLCRDSLVSPSHAKKFPTATLKILFQMHIYLCNSTTVPE